MQFLATIQGNFPLIRQIAKGGQAVIYLSQHPVTGKDAVIKIPLVNNFEPFINEVRLTNTLIHNSIIKQELLNIISTDGKTEIAVLMGYYPNTLLDVDREKITLETAIGYLIEVCSAVAFVHEHGVIHRDIKGVNILLTTKGKPVLADFGISLLKNYGILVGEPIGDIYHSAPEVFLNKPEQKSDVYSLGIVAAKLLTGKFLFRSHKASVTEQLKECAYLHFYQEPPDMSELPPEIERSIREALQKVPAKRPTAKQFGENLQAALQLSKDWGLPQTESLTLLPQALVDLRYRNHIAQQETKILLLEQIQKLFAFIKI